MRLSHTLGLRRCTVWDSGDTGSLKQVDPNHSTYGHAVVTKESPPSQDAFHSAVVRRPSYLTVFSSKPRGLLGYPDRV